jgi:hypothetical protein
VGSPSYTRSLNREPAALARTGGSPSRQPAHSPRKAATFCRYMFRESPPSRDVRR